MTKQSSIFGEYEMTLTKRNLIDLNELCQDYYKKSKYNKRVKHTLEGLDIWWGLYGGYPTDTNVKIRLNQTQLDIVNKLIEMNNTQWSIDIQS